MTNKDNEKQTLNLEISVDGKKFYQIIDFDHKESEIIENAVYVIYPRLQEMFSRKDGSFKMPKTRIHFRINTFEFENRNDQLYCEAEKNYNKLTSKEIKLLCFFYKGFKQNVISFIFSMALNTLHSHRKSIYRKLGFENKSELISWCDRYL